MSNLTNNEFSVALNNYFHILGTLAEQLVELVSVIIKTAGSIIEPVTKSVSGIAGNTSTTVTKVYQGAASAVAPKQ
ncbi:MAG: chlorosome envelope protein B [Chlorobiaceae bacterium]|nr:chlorosome envelope protein B [Chlorobiaceae bacterium]